MSPSCVRVPLQPAAGWWAGGWKLFSGGGGGLAGCLGLGGRSSLSTAGVAEGSPVLVASRQGDRGWVKSSVFEICLSQAVRSEFDQDGGRG